jgi:hypothetical protein
MPPKNYYLVLDTETATLPFVSGYDESIRKKVAIAKPLVYDIGWTVVDTKGNVYKNTNYLVQETFFVPNVFNTAYYKEKRPLYMEKLAQGAISARLWNDIVPELISDASMCKAVCAYNAAFDFKKAIPFTERYIEALYGDYNDFERRQKFACEKIAAGKKNERKNKGYLNPIFEIRGEQFPIIDIWEVACQKLINIQKYKKYCLENRLWSNSVVYFKTGAETTFQYVMKDYDFVEAHTALNDAEIEAQILAKALHKGHLEPCIGSFSFQHLGTTVDFCESNQKYCEELTQALSAYAETLKAGTSYQKKIENLLKKLLTFSEN